MKTIATTGGGTAGHVLPSIALLPELKNNFDRIIHIAGVGMEQEIIPKAGIPLFITKTIKFNRSNILKNLKIPFVLLTAIRQAKEILIREKVDVVFSKGGYVSLPTVFAAKRIGIPIIIHESDFHMGLANKLSSIVADCKLTSFPETKGGEYVGNPIRERIFHGNKEKVIRAHNLSRNKKTILIFGGSSGSLAINNAIFKIAKDLIERFNVIHIIGKNEKRRLFINGYVTIPYVDDIENYYAVADLIIMRGGANSLQEATALGKRIICIPLPKSNNSRGDQVDNAMSYCKRNLITLIHQEDLNGNVLIEKIHETINQKEHPINKDTPNGEIVKRIMTLVNSNN